MPKRRVATPEPDGATVLADFAARSAEARATAPRARASALRAKADQVVDAEPSDETIAGTTEGAGGAETEILPVDYPPTGSEALEAWSAEEPEPEPELDGSWHAAFSKAALPLFVAAVVAFGIVVAGWLMIDNRREDTPVAAPLPAAALPPISTIPVKAVLDGTYRIDVYPAQATYWGRTPPPPADNATKHWFWAFRSMCTETGCAAHGALMDKDDHRNFSAIPDADDMTFVNGVWRDATNDNKAHDCGSGKTQTVSALWEFEPQPDSTLHGTITHVVISDECGNLGNKVVEPLVVTRVGDAPPVLEAPATIPPVAPAPDVPRLPEQVPSQQDEDLLAELANHGVLPAQFHAGNAVGAAGEVVAAHVICEFRGKGTSTSEIISDLVATKGFDLTDIQAEWLARIAIRTYCPQYGG
jgi:hypothetical protein